MSEKKNFHRSLLLHDEDVEVFQFNSKKRKVDENLRTLKISNLPVGALETELLTLIPPELPVIQISIARESGTEECIGYAHIEFQDRQAADKAMEALQGKVYPRPYRVLEVAWAPRNLSPQVESYQLFLGNLPESVKDGELTAAIKEIIPNVKAAKVIMNLATGVSRCYGFARFEDDEEAEDAKIRLEIKGFKMMDKHVLVKRVNRSGQGAGEQGSSVANTTIVITNLSEGLGDADLRTKTEAFGKVHSLKFLYMKHQAFITFYEHVAAIAAQCSLDGHQWKGQVLQANWGRLTKNVNFKLRLEERARDEKEKDEDYAVKYEKSLEPIPVVLKPEPEEKEQEQKTPKTPKTKEEQKYWALKFLEEEAKKCEADGAIRAPMVPKDHADGHSDQKI